MSSAGGGAARECRPPPGAERELGAHVVRHAELGEQTWVWGGGRWYARPAMSAVGPLAAAEGGWSYVGPWLPGFEAGRRRGVGECLEAARAAAEEWRRPPGQGEGAGCAAVAEAISQLAAHDLEPLLGQGPGEAGPPGPPGGRAAAIAAGVLSRGGVWSGQDQGRFARASGLPRFPPQWGSAARSEEEEQGRVAWRLGWDAEFAEERGAAPPPPAPRAQVRPRPWGGPEAELLLALAGEVLDMGWGRRPSAARARIAALLERAGRPRPPAFEETHPEGWLLAEEQETGVYRIQKWDGDPGGTFASDEDARAHVFLRAAREPGFLGDGTRRPDGVHARAAALDGTPF